MTAQTAAVIASAPGALDTLNELAAAMGNDANFAATITNAMALKAPLASPTFTGTPAVPTAAADITSLTSHAHISFSVPVNLLANSEYTMVLMCDDTDAALAVAELGKRTGL